MRKSFFILLLFGVIAVFSIQPIRAHLAGAFEDFLIGLQDADSDKPLQEAIEDTKQKHELLALKTEEEEKRYEKEQEKMMEMMTFYDTVAVDVYASFLLQGEEMVNMMANKQLIEQKVATDIKKLEQFYDRYEQLKQALESVKGYKDLLDEIKANNEAKTRLQTIFPKLLQSDKQGFASLLQAIWNQDMVKVDEYLVEDSKELSAQLANWTEESYTNNIRYLSYHTLNEKSKLTYLIQNDHVYVTHANGDGHMILITQLKKHPNKPYAYYLEMEAGFLNGYAISQSILEDLNGLFVLSYKDWVDEENSDWIIQQRTNQLVIQPTRTAGD